MSPLTAIVTILAALLIGAMSPGPSFVLVARNSIGLSRRDGLATAVGMGVGGVFFAGIALVGLYTLLAAVEWLYVSLKVAGGLYLIYIASKIWRGASAPLSAADASAGRQNPRKSFWVGLSTQLSNPKTSIFYGSAVVVLHRAAAARVRDRSGLVHGRRAVLFEPASARTVCEGEIVDRSCCGRRDRRARSAPGSDCAQSRNLTALRRRIRSCSA